MKPLSLFIPCATALFLAAMSVHAQQQLPVENAGFENDLRNWSNWKEQPEGIVRISPDQGRDGSSALHLSNMDINGTGRIMAFQTVQNIEPGAIYHLTAWAKSDASPRGSVRVALKLEFYDSEGKNTSGVNGFSSLVQGADWEQISAVGIADEKATSVRIYVRLFTKGSIYYDNVELTQPALLIDEPTRLIHLPGEPLEARVIVWAKHEGGDEALPEFSMEATNEGNTTSHTTKVEALGGNRYAVTATVPPITTGHYDLNVKLNGELSRRTVRTYPTHKNRKPTRLSDTGTILYHGKPFFPIGMYHPQNYTYYKAGGTSNTVEGAEADYALLAQHGFNAIQGSSVSDLDEFGRYLDLAEKHNLAVDVPFYANGHVAKNLENSLAKIERFKNHPAVLNWKISDEPDIRPEIINEVPDAYYAMKGADREIPIEITLATDHTLENWAQFADIIQIDRYPVPGQHLTAVSNYTRLAMAAKAPWQNVSFVVQSGWSPDLSNQPTAAQARSMVYLALIEGAKGIWWYSMYDPGWDLTKTPLWPELKAINAEIQALSEPLMLGEKVEGIGNRNAKVHFRAMKHEGKLYVLITNPEETPESTTLSIPLSGIDWNGATLDGKPVSASEGKLTLDLPATDSRTLIFTVQ